MKAEEEIHTARGDAPAKEAMHDSSREVVEHDAPGAAAGRGWLAHLLEAVTMLLRDAKHGPPDYRVFLMALAVIVFCMYALWILRPR